MTDEERKEILDFIHENPEEALEVIKDGLKEFIDQVHKYQTAHRRIVKDYVEAGLIPAYTSGFIHLDRQFCTLGM